MGSFVKNKPVGVVRFLEKNDIRYGQDHGFYRGLPVNVPFEVTAFPAEQVMLVGPGHGELGGSSYGNGALYVSADRFELGLMASEVEVTVYDDNTKECRS